MVSVIVCTFNREKYLITCLEHLAKQSCDPQDFEIVIVNNNSPDQTDKICQKFIEQHPHLQITYHIELQQGHTYSRNAGIEKSKGEILAFIDDDAFPNAHFINHINASFMDPETMAIGGKIAPIYEDGSGPKWMSTYLLPLVSALDMGNTTKTFNRSKHPIGANMAFRKSVFDQLGLFDTNLGRRGTDGLEGGDEKELFIRMKRADMKIMYQPKVFVEHIIGEKRITPAYVRGLAIGVGSSEKKRLKGIQLVNKWISEGIKFGGSVILSIGYLICGRPQAAWMLIQFRIWVAKGLLS